MLLSWPTLQGSLILVSPDPEPRTSRYRVRIEKYRAIKGRGDIF